MVSCRRPRSTGFQPVTSASSLTHAPYAAHRSSSRSNAVRSSASPAPAAAPASFFGSTPITAPNTSPPRNPSGPVMKIPSSGPWFAPGARMIGPKNPSPAEDQPPLHRARHNPRSVHAHAPSLAHQVCIDRAMKIPKPPAAADYNPARGIPTDRHRPSHIPDKSLRPVLSPRPPFGSPRRFGGCIGPPALSIS